MKLKKRQAYAIAGLLILISGLFVVYAIVDKTTAWHTQDEILVEIIPDCFVTLGNAISNEWLKDIGTPSCISVLPDLYHLASEITIDIGSIVTLQDAIGGGYFTGTNAISSSSLPTTQVHPATEIEVDINGVKSLQEALFELRCVRSCSGKACGADDGCGNPCQTGTCVDVWKECVSGTCTPIGNCESLGETRTFSCANLNDECGIYSDGIQTCANYNWEVSTACIEEYSNIGETPCTPDVWGAVSTSMRACDGMGNCIGENGAGCIEDPSPYSLTFYRDGDDYKYNLAGGYVADWSTAQYSWSGGYTRDDPVCQVRTCVRRFIVCLEWSNSPRYWRIKPAPCTSVTCPSPSQVPCGTTDTRYDNCGVQCNVLGTSRSNCNSGGVCYNGACCTPSSCPSSSEVWCGTRDRSYVGCGESCNVYGSNCGPSTTLTCTSGSCTCTSDCPSPSEVTCGTLDTSSDGCGANCFVTGTKCGFGESCIAGTCF